MNVAAVRGAVGFLSRIPVGGAERDWDAFRANPATFPLVGYLVGGVLAVVLLVPGPALSVGTAFVVAVYLLTGITHLDGVADLGDAAVVHGDRARRRSVMSDADVGTGGVLGVVLVVFALGSAGVALATLGRDALAVVVLAEVSAKTAMAALVCFGTAGHDGLGSALTNNATGWNFLPVAVLAVPALALSWPRLGPGVAAVTGAGAVAVGLLWWARANLGGVSGDVLGATNELARVAALHAGVMAWTLS